MLLNKDFFGTIKGAREERILVLIFLDKIGIEDPFDGLFSSTFETIKEKVTEDVALKDFDLEGVEEKINVVFNHVFTTFTFSEYYDVISEPKRVSLKNVLSTLRKGLIELYQSEYEKEVKRKEEAKKEAQRETLFEALLEELKK